MASKDKIKKMKEKSKKRRLEKAKKFSDKLVDKLGDKVKCVAVYGSVSKEEHTHESDIDTFVVLDDTKLKKDVPKETKNKIRQKVIDLAKSVDEKITIQYFLFLTEFWDSIKKGEPLIITVLRLGIPVYDVGVFKPAKRLLERGKISSSREAVRKRMKLAVGGFKKCQKQLKSSIPHTLEQVIANAGQAPVMMVGKNPPPKEDVPKVLEEMFVENDMLDEKYVKLAKEVHQFSKDAEKNKIDINGKKIDEQLEKVDEFVKKMGKLMSQLGARKKVKGIVDDYKTFLKANVAALKSKGIQPPESKEDLPEMVEEELDVDQKYVNLFDKWNDVISNIKDKKLDEVNEKELYELKSDTREFVSKVGKELRELKQEETEITSNLETDKIAAQAKKAKVDDEETEEEE